MHLSSDDMFAGSHLTGGRKVKRGKIVGAALFSWWVFVLVAFGVASNAFLLFKAFQAGNTMAMLLFGAFFCGACVYLYRTYDARDEIRGNFRD